MGYFLLFVVPSSYLFFHSAKLRVQGLEVVPVVPLSIYSCLHIPEGHLPQPVQRAHRDIAHVL